jgi:hypothetical protein
MLSQTSFGAISVSTNNMLLVRWQGNRRHDTYNSDHDHDFDQGKTCLASDLACHSAALTYRLHFSFPY